MKDAEFVAQLLLLTERGTETYSQDDLDTAYSVRDEDWEDGARVEREYRAVLDILARWSEGLLAGEAKRLRNQADFYSIYGALLGLHRDEALPDDSTAVERLERFMDLVNSEERRQENGDAKRYFEAARSASNDAAQRRERIRILTSVLTGEHSGGGA